MGASIVLLLVGTEILAWYWLAVLFGGGLAVGVWRTTRRFPSAYELTQTLDRRLGFADSLSTALHFRVNPGRSNLAVREAQQRQAEDLARSADLKAALPYRAPRSLYAAAGLAVAAFSLFGLRYGVTHTLDLRQGLVRIAFDSFFPSTGQTAHARKSAMQKKIEEELKKIGIDADSQDSKAADAAPDSVLNVVDEPNLDSADPEAAKTKADGKAAKQPPGDDPEAGGENPESAAPGSEANASDSSSPSKEGGSQGEKPGPQKGGESPNGGGSNDSLMNKMKDAMANLLNKLKMPPKPGDGKESASNSQNGNLQSGSSQQAGKKGSQSSNRESPDGANSAEQQGDQQQAESGQNAQAAQGKSGDKSADRPASQDAKSGIGRQDGDKSAREAADLAAMGKISEIIGKRSANVTGEVMVEVASGKQQLKTPYAQKNATHGESGGEINRDEVPLIYQQYVQQYFEEIRKAPAVKPTDSAPARKTAKGGG